MRLKRLQYWIAMCFVSVPILLSVYPAPAHDLWLNLDNHFPKVGTTVNAKVIFGHNYPYADILLTRDRLADFSYLCPDGKKVQVTKVREEKQNERSGALVGEIVCDREGTYVVSACLERKGDKEHVPAGKYGKSLMVAGQDSDVINRPLGQRMEIVPLKHPAGIKAGESMPVKIPFEGKPLSTYVYATYAGYYSETEPFPVFVKSDTQGLAQVPIDRAGTWMIVSNHKVDFSASVTFQIEQP